MRHFSAWFPFLFSLLAYPSRIWRAKHRSYWTLGADPVIGRLSFLPPSAICPSRIRGDLRTSADRLHLLSLQTNQTGRVMLEVRKDVSVPLRSTARSHDQECAAH